MELPTFFLFCKHFIKSSVFPHDFAFLKFLGGRSARPSPFYIKLVCTTNVVVLFFNDTAISIPRSDVIIMSSLQATGIQNKER